MIEEQYKKLCILPSDIYEHLPTLKKYAEQSETVVELGMRKIVSTWAFLAGKPKHLISVDITHPKEYGADLWEVVDAAQSAGIEFDFVLKSSLEIDLPEHDFLFIDTLHTYAQLTAELERHHTKVKKFIAMHDTNLAGDPDNMRGAVNDFLDKRPEWAVAEHFDNCNGLTVLKRIKTSMIAGIFHKGSGLGDQLFRYVTVRTLAEEKGFEWGMIGEFKGKEFMNLLIPKSSQLNAGQEDYLTPEGETFKRWSEKEVRGSNGVDIRSYDPEINFVKDNTIIDGSFEDSKYWGHNLDNISKWLAVEPLAVPDDVCVVGFRGGEYYADPDLGLPKEYFHEAIARMRKINPNMCVHVHTDDTILAKQLFPDCEVIDNPKISHSKNENMGFNWRSARFAKYAIIPNSAFFILPRLLKHHEDPTAITIAPRYWARHNTKVWARPACYYIPFTYTHASDTHKL